MVKLQAPSIDIMAAFRAILLWGIYVFSNHDEVVTSDRKRVRRFSFIYWTFRV